MDKLSDDLEFHFARTSTPLFQTTLQRIREQSNIKTSFVVRYLFEGNKATAVVPNGAASQFSEEQFNKLSEIT